MNGLKYSIVRFLFPDDGSSSRVWVVLSLAAFVCLALLFLRLISATRKMEISTHHLRQRSPGRAPLELPAKLKFSDTATDRDSRFSIGRELESGRYYLSIPVANPHVDYEEYYEIDQAMHDSYPTNLEELRSFAEACRRQKNDALLLQTPGRLRGVS